MQTVSILGCGWLGLPLASHLLSEGYVVKGSVTSQEKKELLKQKGIIPYQIQITDHEITGDDLPGFFASDILVINFPPARREDIVAYHTAQMSLLAGMVRSKHVLFVSSTSVYPDLNREVTEADSFEPAKGSGKALVAAEDILQAFSCTVLRFAGLIGYDRKPGRFLAGKKDVANGDGPINVIHQDDCIGIITAIIQQGVWGEVFNACSDVHPTRRKFYTLAAEKAGLELPTFSADAVSTFKIINSDKLKNRLGYSFKYPDPLKTL
jgi:nucleoside-diphosphate-sugar epimerase